MSLCKVSPMPIHSLCVLVLSSLPLLKVLACSSYFSQRLRNMSKAMISCMYMLHQFLSIFTFMLMNELHTSFCCHIWCVLFLCKDDHKFHSFLTVASLRRIIMVPAVFGFISPARSPPPLILVSIAQLTPPASRYLFGLWHLCKNGYPCLCVLVPCKHTSVLDSWTHFFGLYLCPGSSLF